MVALELVQQFRAQQFSQRRSRNRCDAMHGADSFERMHALVERIDEGRLDRRRKMDDMSEPFVGDRDDCCIITRQFLHDAIEALEVDRLAADLDEVACSSKHPQRSSVHVPQILGDEPAVDLRIDEALLGRVAGEERRSAKG